MLRCPKCNSLSVYENISIAAKAKINGNKNVFDVNKDDRDNTFESVGCSKCSWTGMVTELKEYK